MTTILGNKFKGMQHIGIPTLDVKMSEEFYNRLGFTKVMEGGFIEEGEPGVAIMMKRENAILEFFQLPPKMLDAVKLRKDGHVDHIAFDVEDVDAAFSEIKAAGFTLLQDEPVSLNFWTKGCRFFTILGPNGEKLEFNQIL
jgi:catechol 2,3-dioxygenase-like lactoylglutathione lyase family enzyme